MSMIISSAGGRVGDGYNLPTVAALGCADRALGIRVTAVMGGSLAAVAMLASSFFVNDVDMLCFTYGILYGLGASLAYTPSLTILGHYFKRHLGVVNGIVTIGSSVFTVIMPPLMDYVIYTHGLSSMFHLLAVLSFGIALCGLLFKPTPLMTFNRPSREHSTFKTLFENVVNVEIWKNKKYRLWALSTPICLFGYFVPYVHIKTFITERFPGENSNIPLQCVAAASGLGRAAFGFFADRTKVDKILLQQISFYVIGSLTIVLPFVGSFGLLVVISLAMGLFDGAFISLIGPIGFELCGSSGAAQAIGNMLGLAAIPLSVGPPVAAHLYTLHRSYTLPFVLAGITPLIGATLMFAIHLQRHDSVATSDANRQPRRKNDSVQDVVAATKLKAGRGAGRGTGTGDEIGIDIKIDQYKRGRNMFYDHAGEAASGKIVIIHLHLTEAS
ncbi:Monocarboxylate transporter 10 [Eumeta japonica]|uniref:Monocarboxylate transporter 10 n=1 Tax=Eumeta variegata TaxID=151549 RepID=A0A4C1VUW1_EUMVA|nr:Monocarboxylate transporter 10 [Eumeta japonica]